MLPRRRHMGYTASSFAAAAAAAAANPHMAPQTAFVENTASAVHREISSLRGTGEVITALPVAARGLDMHSALVVAHSTRHMLGAVPEPLAGSGQLWLRPCFELEQLGRHNTAPTQPGTVLHLGRQQQQAVVPMLFVVACGLFRCLCYRPMLFLVHIFSCTSEIVSYKGIQPILLINTSSQGHETQSDERDDQAKSESSS